MLVLQVLRYDICAITPHDFVDLLLSRLPISSQQAATVRQHTQTFIALCATGLCSCHQLFDFVMFKVTSLTPELSMDGLGARKKTHAVGLKINAWAGPRN